MKARKKNSNNEWQDIVYVQLKDSDILYKQEYLEFDTLSTELKTNEQIADETHGKKILIVHYVMILVALLQTVI